MAWDSEAFRLQSQLRNLFLEDPDACIQAVARLRPEEVERLELLVQLGKDFQNQPSSSGIVDAGLTPFPSLREISSLRLSDDGPTSFGVPQSTVSTSGVSGDPQNSTVSQGEQEGTVGQDVQGNSNNGPPNPWEGWHPGLLGQAPASSAQSVPRVLGPDGQRRESLRSRDLQPGTLGYPPAQAPREPTTSRRTEPRTGDVRHLLPPGLDALEEGAFQFLDWFHGAPFALYSKVGYDAGLPPVHNLDGLYPLRPRRERCLPSALRRRNFSIHGYCLLSCQAHCGWACSRPVSTDARQLHDHHFCQVCHR